MASHIGHHWGNMADLTSLIVKIEKHYDLPKIYHSLQEQEHTLPALCKDIGSVIDRFIQHENAKSAFSTSAPAEGLLDDELEAVCLNFLKKSMPIVIELLLRRKTQL